MGRKACAFSHREAMQSVAKKRNKIDYIDWIVSTTVDDCTLSHGEN